MTGKEIVNLINKLEEEGMTAEKIIEIIKYVETADPKDPSNNKQQEKSNYKNQGAKSFIKLLRLCTFLFYSASAFFNAHAN